MGTRTLIRLKEDEKTNNSVMLYVHNDGYPSHIVPWLANRMRDFLANREPCNGYFMAYLLKSLFDMPDSFNINKSIYTGYGLFHDKIKGKNCTKFGDYGSEYVYTVNLEDSTITVQTSPRKKTVISVENLISKEYLKSLER